MLKCFYEWIPSTIHSKLFRRYLKIATERLGYENINERHASHFFIEGFRAAREIAEMDNDNKENLENE